MRVQVGSKFAILAVAAVLVLGLASWGKTKAPTVSSQIKEPENVGTSVVTVGTATVPPGVATDLCFTVTINSPDFEYIEYISVDLPDTWTVNSVANVPLTGCAGHTTTQGVAAGNVVYWQDTLYPPATGCGSWVNGTYSFCCNVTLPDCTGSPFTLPWTIIGDGWGAAPHNTSGTVGPITCGAVQPPLWYQPLDATSAYVDQSFPDYPTYSSYLSDDFTNAEDWCIERIFVPGSGWNGFSTLLNATSLTWQIYADSAGIPAGNPEGAAPWWTLTLAPTDAMVTLTPGSDGYLSNTLLTLPTPLVVPPGTWWLVFYPTMGFGAYGQYGRQPATTINGYVGQFINPGGGFGHGTAWQNWYVLGASQHDIAFRLDGTVCGTGPAYDANFHDQYNRSELCLDSATGDYVYNVLSGPYAGQSFTGTANIVPYTPTLYLFSTPCPAGSTHCLSGNWNTVRHSASAVLRSYSPTRFSSTLFDANYTDSPPCGAPVK